MPDRQTQHICYKCGAVLPIEKMGCGCVKRCDCTYLQDGAKIVCGDCVRDALQTALDDRHLISGHGLEGRRIESV